MKKVLILLFLLVLAVFVFAGDDDEIGDQTESTLPPVSNEITVEASSTSNI